MKSIKRIILYSFYLQLVNGFQVSSNNRSTFTRSCRKGGYVAHDKPSVTSIRQSALSLSFFNNEATANAFESINYNVVDFSSTLISHEEYAPHITEGTGVLGLLETLIYSPVLWAIFAMLSIVALLLAWEESVKTVKETIPKALLPVVDSILAEIGGLGFIGLILETFVTKPPVSQVLGGVSNKYLGEPDTFIEVVEVLHQIFFEVGIGFFVVSALIVASVLSEIQKLSEISELALDTDGDGEVSLEELAEALQVEAMVVDTDGDGELSEEEITVALQKSQRKSIFEEIFAMGEVERGAEALVIRERMIIRDSLPDSFLVDKYFEEVFAHNLEEIVELSPLTWLPLIPFLALDNSIDLSHGVVSVYSKNAFETCGFFFSTPWFLAPSLFLSLLSLGWGLTNSWKMSHIKQMLTPTLVKDGENAVLLPPRFMDTKLRSLFTSSPPIVKEIEEILGGEPGRDDHQRLFGAAGSKGPHMYLNSIKFHTWLCVAQVVFYGVQIIGRDVLALVSSVDTLNVEAIYSEIYVYGGLVGLALLQLSIAPKTFLNHATITSIENMTKNWAIDRSIPPEECIIAEDKPNLMPLGKNNEGTTGDPYTLISS